MDLERQKRVMLGAAMIEAREREAMAVAQPREPSVPHHPLPEPAPSAPVSAKLNDLNAPEETTGTIWRGKPNPFAHVPEGADETQSWTPRAVRRG